VFERASATGVLGGDGYEATISPKAPKAAPGAVNTAKAVNIKSIDLIAADTSFLV
jgi:hypothetical protein